MLTRNIVRGWSNHIFREARSHQRRAQALGRRCSGRGLHGQKVGDCGAGRGKFKVGSVDHFRSQRGASSYADRLRAVMSLAATSTASRASLRAAHILSAREFVAGVVDHLVRDKFRRSVGTHVGDLPRKNHHNENQKRFQQQRGRHVPMRGNTVRSFASQARPRAGKCGADGSNELFPARRPLYQEFWCIVDWTGCRSVRVGAFRSSVNLFFPVYVVWIYAWGNAGGNRAAGPHLDLNSIS